MNVIDNFNTSNSTVRGIIEKLLAVKPVAPTAFRLSVQAADDIAEEGTGQYALEAQAVRALLSIAYGEIVSAATRGPRKDNTPVADRAQGEFDQPFDGGEGESETVNKLETELEALESEVDKAIDRCSVILGYAHHISNIKWGGAEWLKGFSVTGFKAVDPADAEAVAACLDKRVDKARLIQDRRVVFGTETVDSFLQGFEHYCVSELAREVTEKTNLEWRARVAMAGTQGIYVPIANTEVVMNMTASVVQHGAYGKEITSLERSIVQAANKAYKKLAFEIHVEGNDVNKLYKAAIPSLMYSTWLAKDVALTKASEAWKEHEEMLAEQAEDAETEKAIKDFEKQVHLDARAAVRAQAAFVLEQRMASISEQSARTAGIYAAIAAQKAAIEAARPRTADELKAEAEAKAKEAKAAKAKEAKAAKAKEAKAAKAEAKKLASGAKKPNKPSALIYAHR